MSILSHCKITDDSQAPKFSQLIGCGMAGDSHFQSSHPVYFLLLKGLIWGGKRARLNHNHVCKETGQGALVTSYSPLQNKLCCGASNYYSSHSDSACHKEGLKKKETKTRERRIQFALKGFYSCSQQPFLKHSFFQPFKAGCRFDWLELQHRPKQYCLASSALVFHVVKQLRKYCISRILSS